MEKLVQGLLSVALVVVAAPLLLAVFAGMPPLWFLAPILLIWWISQKDDTQKDDDIPDDMWYLR